MTQTEQLTETAMNGLPAMDGPHNSMTAFVKASNHVLDIVEKRMPKFALKHSAGIILLSGGQFGWLISVEWATGLLFECNKETGKFSAPVAVRLDNLGVGLVGGGAAEDIVIVLNHSSMSKLIEGKGHLKVGGEFGITPGKGRAVGATIDGSRQGMGSSEYYCFSRGLMVNAEITMGGINCENQVNKDFYGTESAVEILALPFPEDEGITKLVQRLQEKAS